MYFGICYDEPGYTLGDLKFNASIMRLYVPKVHSDDDYQR
jgi:hypothetical protein